MKLFLESGTISGCRTGPKLLKFWAQKRFCEAISEVVMGRDICILNVPSFDSLTNIVMLDVNMFCLGMKRRVVGQYIGSNIIAVYA